MTLFSVGEEATHHVGAPDCPECGRSTRSPVPAVG
jgi:hypothetical protein